MDFGDISTRGMVLLGCGKMGGAMLQGWLGGGLDPKSVWVLDPMPSAWLKGLPVRLNEDLPEDPAVIVVAVKPQMMEAALPALSRFGSGGTLFLSIAAGTRIGYFESLLGAETPVIRVMPNTPAAIGRAISVLVGNGEAGEDRMRMAEALLSAVGNTVRLDSESKMDAVTAVSGSGPAYVFHLIETLAAAGEAEGLEPELAMILAKETVAGAGALALEAGEAPDQLRVNVTSPGGTTEAALRVLMDPGSGFPALMRRAVRAATVRGRELGQ